MIKGSKLIKNIVKQVGGGSDDLVRSASKKLGYKVTGSSVSNAGKAVDINAIKNTMNELMEHKNATKNMARTTTREVAESAPKNTNPLSLSNITIEDAQKLKNDFIVDGDAGIIVKDPSSLSNITIEEAMKMKDMIIDGDAGVVIKDTTKNVSNTTLEEAMKMKDMVIDGDSGELIKDTASDWIPTPRQAKTSSSVENVYTKADEMAEATADMINKQKAEAAAKATTSGGTTSGGTASNNGNLKGKSPKISITTEDLKGKRYDSKDDYMRYKTAKEWDQAIESFKKKDYNNPILSQLKKDGMDFKKTSVVDLLSRRKQDIRSASHKDMQFGDWMGYHQVPEKAVAGMGTVWLVNKLASSGGQQTNAQLYGQQPY